MILLLLATAAHADICTGYESPVLVASIPGITEASGLVTSRQQPGVWYTHNDAGGAAELYAFDLQGNNLGTFPVGGASFWDWEDISGGPCPSPNTKDWCFYIGDTGDNGHVRSNITVYAVRDPSKGESIEVLATWDVTYPTGAEDSETLFVHPLTGRIYVVTKTSDGISEVFRLPAEPTKTATAMEWVATLSFPTYGAVNGATTGGDWEIEGHRLAIRTYSQIFEWVTDPCDPDAHWGDIPDAWTTTDIQGESVAYTPDGHLLTASERDPMLVQELFCTRLLPGPACGDETGETGQGTETAETDIPDDTAKDTSKPVDSSEQDSTTSDTADAAGPGFYSGGMDCGGSSKASLIPALLIMLGWTGRRSVIPATRIDPGTGRCTRHLDP